MMDKLERFRELSNREVQHLREGGFSPEQYYEQTRSFLMNINQSTNQ
jgi:hypothetical protein